MFDRPADTGFRSDRIVYFRAYVTFLLYEVCLLSYSIWILCYFSLDTSFDLFIPSGADYDVVFELL